ncbi:baseplate multidomain protein megatron [Loktanella sp. S4079]|uniref:baseplate multidomain protein megatron n=1 Tax=Loktanella sp. S4079 TaxID=579483 RepID=UPI0005FA8FA2|nr:glycoside hydrolase/phage tail family protein [Loktanella sp. S4079]KJZ20322.1 phage host specificity protein [Loktanella sp. S4079]
MATIVLSAAGMAIGGSIGGTVMGLSMAAIGRAAGAAIGRHIDQKLFGSGSDAIETGRVDRFRLTSAGEGGDLQQVYGRMRVPGQVIWASDFEESSKTSGGGKGAPSGPEVTSYSYSVSLAVALCEGQISRIGRIWADGVEISQSDLNMRLYTGTLDQQPDPKIAAIEGLENTPAYRGTAYVVFEDLGLAKFGNRVPQLTFEVMRPGADELGDLVTGVALIPGTGEYGLATSQVHMSPSYGEHVAVNTNSPMGGSDFTVSMNALQEEVPACGSVVMVVSWFGDDLRCGSCSIKPKVEQKETDAEAMPWEVSGISRSASERVPQLHGAPVYGGTPTDASVIEALRDMKSRGLSAVFYPFILMEQLDGNLLPDPWSGEVGQAALPWRGRITTALAPYMDGTTDGTAMAEAEVAAFMGQAEVSDFTLTGGTVNYSGNDWGYRRFILHYAHLCAAAGGVSAFCIGSEMRALTQIRGANNSFPAVEAFRALAADVRQILGPDCKISYAADWSEYHGYQPAGTGDKFFHLDALWADPNIDFIGVDNYMPLADWRDGDSHADIDAGAIYNLDYLKSNVAGGEGFDWYYTTPEARAAQRRTPITDAAGEPWVWRYKDFAGWWSHPHHNRVDGVRSDTPTAWVPESKPIWFTEFGCAAIVKGANQPNKFIDPKSSESQLPYYSNGNRDDFMQMQYIRAVYGHFSDAAHNPVSSVYGAPMVDTNRMHVWAWDARPYPFFPGNRSLWSDGDNYARGHWLNGRVTNRALASVVAEICERSGVSRFDVSRLHGVVRGFAVDQITSGRSALQPLMTTYGFDAMERDGVLVFENRAGRADHVLTDDDLALDTEKDQVVSLTRSPAAEVAARIQVVHLDSDGDYEAIAAEAVHPDKQTYAVNKTEVPLALTRSEGRNTVTRWLQETRIARDQARFALPPSLMDVGAGDVVSLDTDQHKGLYRVDRVEEAGLRLIEATRIDAEAYRGQTFDGDGPVLHPYVGPVPVEALFLDLPLLRGDEVPTAPYVAVAGRPWPGNIALYSAPEDSGYSLQTVIEGASIIGITQSPLPRGPVGIWDRQEGLELTLIAGELSSVTVSALLSGANTLAIGDGTPDKWEIIQFAKAIPVGERRYRLSGLLRGQAGSRGIMPDEWPTGSKVVILDGTPAQIDLPASSRGVPRHLRYGPAERPMTDPSYRYAVQSFHGNGLRPYPVAHLRVDTALGDIGLSWIRCSRIDGDQWGDAEIPLGEENESYQIRVVQDGIVRRQETTDTPHWSYPEVARAAEVGETPYRIEVAQLSARFGAGPYVGVNMQF